MAEPGADELGPEARLGAALRRAREERGISLRGLARRLYRAHSNLVEYERGHRLAPIQVVEAYETHLGLTRGALLQHREQAEIELWGEHAQRDRHISPSFPPELALHQLPAEIANFTGRAAELAQLRAVVADHRSRPGSAVIISAISGMGGVGKSALALHLAHELAPRFPDAQLFVDLHGYEPRQRLSPGQALDRFLRALGVADEQLPVAVEEQAARYRALLAGKRALMVLDNASSAEQVRLLLPGSPSCLVLVTSRSSLAGLVATEGARLLSLDVLSPEDALDLLRQVIGEERVCPEPKEAAEIVRLCGYLPLAIRIAGARLAIRSAMRLSDLAERLASTQRLSELTAGDRGVRASFGLSYEDLEPGAARIFRLLGLVAGPSFGAGVAAALADTTVREAERLLEALADAHLIEVAADPGRYRFHDLLRLYARERVEASESERDRNLAIRRMLEWYLVRADGAEHAWTPARRRLLVDVSAEQRGFTFADHKETLAWFQAEQGNLVPAIHLAAEHGLHSMAWQLPDALRTSFAVRRRWADFLEAHEIGLTAAQKADDPEAEAWMLTSVAISHCNLGMIDKALDCLHHSLELCRKTGDLLSEGRTLRHLGALRLHLGAPNEAVDCFRRSLMVSQEVGYQLGEEMALHQLGEAYRHLRQFDKAIQCQARSLAISRELRDRRGEGGGIRNLGQIYLEADRITEARDCLEQALTIFREVADDWHEGLTLKSLGLISHRSGDTEAARTCWQCAFTIFSELRDPEAEEVRRYLEELIGGRS